MIAGLAYELIRYAGKHQDNRVLMTLLAPGLWLQRLTTREPTPRPGRGLDPRDRGGAAPRVAETPREQAADRKVEVMA